jgi:hypothetical protein
MPILKVLQRACRKLCLMPNPNMTVEEVRDQHRLSLEQFRLNRERIDQDGGFGELDTHAVVGEVRLWSLGAAQHCQEVYLMRLKILRSLE